jgi:outer membrane biosynthesis protein TonB
MSLISWKKWKESSASSRAKRDVALGLKPLAAMSSPFGHSSGPADICDKVLKMVEKDGKKQKKKKKDEAAPNYSLDQFFTKAEKTRDELDAEKQQAEKDEAELDKKIKQKEDQSKLDKNKKKPNPLLDKAKDKEVESDEEEDKEPHNEWEVLCGDLV